MIFQLLTVCSMQGWAVWQNNIHNIYLLQGNAAKSTEANYEAI